MLASNDGADSAASRVRSAVAAPSRRFIRGAGLLLSLVFGWPSLVAAESNEEPVRDVGDRRELFVDDWLIADMRGVSLRLHPPTPREIALPLNQPWSGPTVGFTAVFKDEDRIWFYYSNDLEGRQPD